MIIEWSAHGQSDSNLGHKGQAVADTRINRLTRWLTDSVNHLFCDIMKIENVYQSKTGDALQKWQ